MAHQAAQRRVKTVMRAARRHHVVSQRREARGGDPLRAGRARPESRARRSYRRADEHIAAVLIGERPGLSSPASLGVYLTYRPIRGRSDAERNCISNVRPEGLCYDAAAFKLVHLLEAARGRKLTGVGLKDESVWNQVALPGDDDEQA